MKRDLGLKISGNGEGEKSISLYTIRILEERDDPAVEMLERIKSAGDQIGRREMKKNK